MNHQGGILLIGVDDSGNPVGIEADYDTFNRPNWDGFERCLISTVTTRLGGRHCTRIHIRCASMATKSIAVIEVESAEQPVYCRDGNTDRYFVRTGNSTRELHVREAIAHISARRDAA
jgi:predicted HTH transcriptional regulator